MKKILTSSLFVSSFILLSIGCSGKGPVLETVPAVPGKYDSLLVKKVVATNDDTLKLAFVDVHKLKKERWIN